VGELEYFVGAIQRLVRERCSMVLAREACPADTINLVE
jgi:hypothetical protein